MWTRRRS
ncbi:hypothetical protein PGANDO_1624, partial [Porphyromonas gingivalis]